MRDTESTVIESADRFANADPAGANERLEDLGNSEFFYPVNVQLFRLVVERHQSVPGVIRQRTRDTNGGVVRNTLRVHEVDKLPARKRTLGIKDCDIEILVESNSPLFPLSDYFFVPPLKVVRIEIKSLHGMFSLFPVPAIRAEYSTDIEENVSDFRHAISTARAGAPSQPSIRSGRQMK